jgi:hypothetical protein
MKTPRLLWTPELEDYLSRPIPVASRATKITWAVLLLGPLVVILLVTLLS